LAFLRFSRDKRGYENFYLVETSTNRRGKTRARVLYWFRTPPGVKVGREPFDADVRRALEAQNPNVVFDWRKISETPIPSADADKWRERRRLERAERSRRRDSTQPNADRADADTAIGEMTEPDEIPGELPSSDDAAEGADAEAAGLDPEDVAAAIVARELAENVAPVVAAEPATTADDSTSDTAAPQPPVDSSRRRRRRRRRRGGHRQPDGTAATVPEAKSGAAVHDESKELSGDPETADSAGPDDPDEV
jgi:hypothetical protein